MAVTVRDVAARAGVTPVVVSRVLHDRASTVRVSAATAERVRQAAKDLGYRVNVMARNFRGGRTNMIGVLHGTGFAPPVFDSGSRYFAALMDGIIEGAFPHGYSVTLCPKLLSDSPGDAIADGRFDGLVWYSTFTSDENRELLAKCAVPFVLIHTEAALLGSKGPSVMCDNEQGMFLAVKHLYDLGHRKIGFASEPDARFLEFEIRRRAFLLALEKLGLRSDQAILDGRSPSLALAISARRFTAIVAANDELGAEVLTLSEALRIPVPDQLSVVGFDSTRFCEELHPQLTSVSQPLKAIGKTAIDLLVSSMGPESLKSAHVLFPCGLDVRGTTRALNS
jgi:LacI family transcriptional regulator